MVVEIGVGTGDALEKKKPRATAKFFCGVGVFLQKTAQ